MKQYTAHTVEETHAIAEELVCNILKRRTEDRKQAVVVALYGELGSGKTTFVQKIARELGVTETVISPTFVIERVYPIRTNVCQVQTTSNEAGKINKKTFTLTPKNFGVSLQSKLGFTLLELLISISIFSFILLGF